MTDDKIDLLLLRHLDPEHEDLREAPTNLVAARLAWLIRQGYLLQGDQLPKWMQHEAIQQPGCLRSLSGSLYLRKLLAQIP